MATNGTSEVVGRFDIKGAKADVAPLDWTKQPGTEGQLTDDHEARRRRQAHDHRFRRPRQRASGQGRRCASPATTPCSRSPCSSSSSARPTSRATGSASRAASRCRCAGPSLELPRVRAMIKARDDLAAKDPGGRRRGGALQHQDDPADPAGPDQARHAGLRQRPPRAGRRAHRLRPTCRSAPARARPSASRRPGRAASSSSTSPTSARC